MSHVDVVAVQPLVALIFGIPDLILPRLLNYLVAIYLILVGPSGRASPIADARRKISARRLASWTC